MEYKYMPITNRSNFGSTRTRNSVRFLVLHWTANTGQGANATAHYRYFQNNRTYSSAHYFVDDKQIVQIVGDSTIAFAVGGNQGYGTALNGCTNINSISVEMCFNSDSDLNKMYFNTVELFKELKRQYPNARLCRHWDATRKDCPHGYTGWNNAKWNKFVNDVNKPRRVILDLSKSSTAKPIGSNYSDSPSQADGWVSAGTGKWNYYKNGKKYAGWILDNNKWYWVEPSTYTQAVGWREIRGKWYYFIGGGAMLTGWLDYNGHKFYFREDGVMVTGAYKIDGKEYKFNPSGCLID